MEEITTEDVTLTGVEADCALYEYFSNRWGENVKGIWDYEYT